jgi:hypothetical protein
MSHDAEAHGIAQCRSRQLTDGTATTKGSFYIHRDIGIRRSKPSLMGESLPPRQHSIHSALKHLSLHLRI